MDFEGEITNKKLPRDIAMERAIIASILIDPNMADVALSLISENKFYDKTLSLCFRAIKDLRNDKNQEIDAMTIRSKMLTYEGVDENELNIDYFKKLLDLLIEPYNIKSYCEKVNDQYIKRQIIKLTSELSVDCYQNRKDTDDVLEYGQRVLYDLAKRKDEEDYYLVRDLIKPVLEKIEEAQKTKDGITGVPTGYRDIDEWTQGFQKTDLIVIGARPSAGKTAFALNLAYNMSHKFNKKVAFFSMEMSAEALVQRLLSMESRIPSEKLRSGRLSQDDWDDIVLATEKIAGENLIIDNTSQLTIAELRSKCRKIKRERGLDIVMLDYIQLMHAGLDDYNATRKSMDRLISNRQEEVAEISRSLKALAKELDVPFVALAQARRSAEGKQETQLSDLKESGAIEQDADLVMFIERNQKKDTDEENVAESNKTIINVAKHRNGRTGFITLRFDKATTKYYDFVKG